MPAPFPIRRTAPCCGIVLASTGPDPSALGGPSLAAARSRPSLRHLAASAARAEQRRDGHILKFQPPPPPPTTTTPVTAGWQWRSGFRPQNAISVLVLASSHARRRHSPRVHRVRATNAEFTGRLGHRFVGRGASASQPVKRSRNLHATPNSRVVNIHTLLPVHVRRAFFRTHNTRPRTRPWG